MIRPNPRAVSGRRDQLVAAVGAALFGILVSACGATSADPPPPPATLSRAAVAVAPPITTVSPLPPAPAPTTTTTAPVVPMETSTPTRVEVPSIGVDSSLISLGLNSDRTVEVPSVKTPQQAGWFKYRATPGSVGAAVILGHINGGGRKGVFSDLSKTQAGARITVTRADRSTAEFTVTRVELFPKTDFPTDLVYGTTDDAQLRLISCGGELDRSANNYLSNVIVFAKLTGTTPA